MMHSMSVDEFYGTLCGIAYKPLLFISSISHDKIRTVDDPCDKCLEVLDKLEAEIHKCIECNDSNCDIILAKITNVCELCSELLLCYECNKRAIRNYLYKRKNLLSYNESDIENCIAVYLHVKFNGVGRRTWRNDWMAEYTDVMWQIARRFPFDDYSTRIKLNEEENEV